MYGNNSVPFHNWETTMAKPIPPTETETAKAFTFFKKADAFLNISFTSVNGKEYRLPKGLTLYSDIPSHRLLIEKVERGEAIMDMIAEGRFFVSLNIVSGSETIEDDRA
jgi:hypothetical protein